MQYTQTQISSLAAGTSCAAGATTVGTIIDFGAASATTAPNEGRLYLRLVNGATAPTAVPRMTVLAYGAGAPTTPPAAPTALDGGGGWYVVHQYRGSLTANRVSSSVFDLRMGTRYLCVVVGEHAGQPVTADALGFSVSL